MQRSLLLPPSSAAFSSSTDSSSAPRRHLERALELAEALGLPEVFAQALTSTSPPSSRTRNRLEEARILLEGALEHRARARPAPPGAQGHQQPGRRARVVRPLSARPRGRAFRPGRGPRTARGEQGLREAGLVAGPISSPLVRPRTLGRGDRVRAAENRDPPPSIRRPAHRARRPVLRSRRPSGRATVSIFSGIGDPQEIQTRLGYLTAKPTPLRAAAMTCAKRSIAVEQDRGRRGSRDHVPGSRAPLVEALEAAPIAVRRPRGRAAARPSSMRFPRANGRDCSMPIAPLPRASSAACAGFEAAAGAFRESAPLLARGHAPRAR